MRVSLRLHGVLRRHHPGPNPHTPFEVDVKSGATVTELAATVGLPNDAGWVASVNGEAVEPDYVLAQGDRVSLFPPAAGG